MPDTGRPSYRYWLAVGANERHLPDVGTDKESQWCLSREVEPGHKFFAYKTRTGIVALWRVTAISPLAHEECLRRKTRTFDAKRIRAFSKPLTYSEMLALTELKDMRGLGGRFQGICFGVQETEYRVIMEALEKKNGNERKPSGHPPNTAARVRPLISQ